MTTDAPDRFCPNCGTEVDADARFCPTCGHTLAFDQSEPMAPARGADAAETTGPELPAAPAWPERQPEPEPEPEPEREPEPEPEPEPKPAAPEPASPVGSDEPTRLTRLTGSRSAISCGTA